MLLTGFSATAPEFVAFIAGVCFFTLGAVALLVVMLFIVDLIRGALRIV